MKITATLEITNERINNLLCSACEGGSNYWIESGRTVKNATPKPEYWYENALGGEIEFTISEGEPIKGKGIFYRLHEMKIRKGLRLMAEKHMRHFADFMDENDDATTGDVFLQLCLFGDVIFG